MFTCRACLESHSGAFTLLGTSLETACCGAESHRQQRCQDHTCMWLRGLEHIPDMWESESLSPNMLSMCSCLQSTAGSSCPRTPGLGVAPEEKKCFKAFWIIKVQKLRLEQNIIGRVLALHAANLDLIPNILCGPPSTSSNDLGVQSQK